MLFTAWLKVEIASGALVSVYFQVIIHVIKKRL